MNKSSAVLISLLAWSACAPPPDSIQREIEIVRRPARVHAPYGAADRLQMAAQAVRSHEARLLPLIDIYDAHSEIARANQIGHRSRFPISRDTRRILQYAHRLSASTEGAWDVTDAALRHVWARHFDERPDELLPEPLVRASRMGVGYRWLDVGEHAMLLLNEATQLDLNEFARPYLIDLAIVHLRRQGAGNVWLEMQSFGRTLGRMADDRNWSLPVYHPLDPEMLLGQLLLTDGSAYARSGWQEDWTTVGGQRTSRIIDPRSGWPSVGDAAVLVVGPVTADTHVLSRALHVIGRQDAAEILSHHPRYVALFVTYADEPEIIVPPMLQPLFQPEPAFRNQVISLPAPPPVAVELMTEEEVVEEVEDLEEDEASAQ